MPSSDELPPLADAQGGRALLEERWFREEVQAHEPVLRRYLRRRFPALADVDDIVQESYLRILRARIAGTLRFTKAFLFATARNASLDIFRRRAVVHLEPLTEETASGMFSDRTDPAEATCLNQEMEILAEALRELPARCREIVILRRIRGLPVKEIARRLSVSEHTVEKQVGIGLRKCVGFMRRRGVAIRVQR